MEKQVVKRVFTVLLLLHWQYPEFCSGVILVHFLLTSGCIQDPISLTSQWITAATAGFTSIWKVKKHTHTAQDCCSKCSFLPQLCKSWLILPQHTKTVEKRVVMNVHKNYFKEICLIFCKVQGFMLVCTVHLHGRKRKLSTVDTNCESNMPAHYTYITAAGWKCVRTYPQPVRNLNHTMVRSWYSTVSFMLLMPFTILTVSLLNMNTPEGYCLCLIVHRVDCNI